MRRGYSSHADEEVCGVFGMCEILWVGKVAMEDM